MRLWQKQEETAPLPPGERRLVPWGDPGRRPQNNETKIILRSPLLPKAHRQQRIAGASPRVHIQASQGPGLSMDLALFPGPTEHQIFQD